MSTSRAQWTGVSFDYFVATFRNSYTMRVGDYFECEAHYRQGDRMPGCLVYRSVAPTVTAAAGNAQGALSRTIMDKRPYIGDLMMQGVVKKVWGKILEGVRADGWVRVRLFVVFGTRAHAETAYDPLENQGNVHEIGDLVHLGDDVVPVEF